MEKLTVLMIIIFCLVLIITTKKYKSHKVVPLKRIVKVLMHVRDTSTGLCGVVKYQNDVHIEIQPSIEELKESMSKSLEELYGIIPEFIIKGYYKENL